jgi:hypothetical protein
VGLDRLAHDGATRRQHGLGRHRRDVHGPVERILTGEIRPGGEEAVVTRLVVALVVERHAQRQRVDTCRECLDFFSKGQFLTDLHFVGIHGFTATPSV